MIDGIREAVHMWEIMAQYLVSHNMLTVYFRGNATITSGFSTPDRVVCWSAQR
jgi:hypothetical protein